MKKVSVIYLVLMSVFLFAGCAGAAAEAPAIVEFPWTVRINFAFEIQDTVTEQAAANLEEYLDAELDRVNGEDVNYTTGENYKMGYSFVEHTNSETGKKTLTLTLEWIDYFNFAKYFDETTPDDATFLNVTQSWSQNLFIQTRTLAFDNPWKSIAGKPKVEEIENKVWSTFGIAGGSEILYDFELNTFRRSPEKVTRWINNVGSYQYFFAYGGADSIERIVIVDNFENGAIWYAIAVGATALFMLIVYFASRAKAAKKGVQFSNPTIQ